MNHTTKMTAIGLVVAALVAGAAIVRAGSVNPPAGPVAPTMHTLEDVYTLANQPPVPPPYNAFYAQIMGPFVTLFVDNGGGFLHSIALTISPLATTTETLRVSDGGLVIAVLHVSPQTSGQTQVFTFDVRYQSTLQIVATGSFDFQDMTVSYLP